MTRPRFSLRGLLLLTALVAGFCWYRDLPRQEAARFSAAVNGRDFAAAEALLTLRYRGIQDRPLLNSYLKAETLGPPGWRANYRLVLLSTNNQDWTLMMKVTAAGVEPRFFRSVDQH
jgi:hypothetical protein